MTLRVRRDGSPIAAIVFDLDGTLIDSRRDLASASNALVAELGGEPLSEPAIAAMVGEGAGVLVARVLEAAGLDPATPGGLDRFLALYDERLLDHTHAYDGVGRLLDALSGRVPLSVLTNKPARATALILEGLGLRTYFSDMLGGDSPFPRKPDPGGLHELASRAGASPASTLLVGDSNIDLLTARAAGARICLARYGFGFKPPGPALVAGDLAIDAPLDLLDVLEL